MEESLQKLLPHLDILKEFVKEINKRAENKMIMTGKLEGAHYASMNQIIKELENK